MHFLRLKSHQTTNLNTVNDNLSVASLRVTLDLLDLLELRVRRVREDPLVSLVPQDLLVAVEQE